MTSPTEAPGGQGWTTGLTDADVRRAMLSSLRLLAIFTVAATAIFWIKAGWPSGALVVVGATISAASLWEWTRLMNILNQAMDSGHTRRPMGLTLVGFFLRLGLTLLVLYVSLKHLHGTVFALAAGLGLGLLSLTIEALRLMNRWTT